MTQTTLVPLSLEQLAKIDGGVLGVLVKQQLAAICRDCNGRPNDKKWRKLTLQVEFRPVSDGHDCVRIEMMTKCKPTLPVYQTAPINVYPKADHIAVPVDGEEGDIDE